MSSEDELRARRLLCKEASNDPMQVTARHDLAVLTAAVFSSVGIKLGASLSRPLPHGAVPPEELLAVSVLLSIASQLTSAANDLFADGRQYAAAALLRQLVEVEYLAWAFDTRDRDAGRWMKSTAEERQKFFTPAKIRKAANGTFRSKDYAYHCELGGHPVPGSMLLLVEDKVASQLLLSDLLGHTGRIWDHLVGWSAVTKSAYAFSPQLDKMWKHYTNWKAIDTMTRLPPPD